MICPDTAPVNQPSMVGRYAPDFELPGTDGDVHHLARYLEFHKAIAIVFLSAPCATSLQVLPRLQQLQEEFAEKGLRLIGISANDRVQVPADDLPAMESFAAQQKIDFPYIRDVTQDVACAFQVSCTPEVFLLDSEGRVRYQGAVDDSPNDASLVSKRYLRSAVMDLLYGQEITVTQTAVEGSAIAWR